MMASSAGLDQSSQAPSHQLQRLAGVALSPSSSSSSLVTFDEFSAFSLPERGDRCLLPRAAASLVLSAWRRWHDDFMWPNAKAFRPLSSSSAEGEGEVERDFLASSESVRTIRSIGSVGRMVIEEEDTCADERDETPQPPASPAAPPRGGEGSDDEDEDNDDLHFDYQLRKLALSQFERRPTSDSALSSPSLVHLRDESVSVARKRDSSSSSSRTPLSARSDSTNSLEPPPSMRRANSLMGANAPPPADLCDSEGNLFYFEEQDRPATPLSRPSSGYHDRPSSTPIPCSLCHQIGHDAPSAKQNLASLWRRAARASDGFTSDGLMHSSPVVSKSHRDDLKTSDFRPQVPGARFFWTPADRPIGQMSRCSSVPSEFVLFMAAPDGSPWQGYCFPFHMQLSPGYPLDPPRLRCLPVHDRVALMHPFICSSTGHVFALDVRRVYSAAPLNEVISSAYWRLFGSEAKRLINALPGYAETCREHCGNHAIRCNVLAEHALTQSAVTPDNSFHDFARYLLELSQPHVETVISMLPMIESSGMDDRDGLQRSSTLNIRQRTLDFLADPRSPTLASDLTALLFDSASAAILASNERVFRLVDGETSWFAHETILSVRCPGLITLLESAQPLHSSAVEKWKSVALPWSRAVTHMLFHFLYGGLWGVLVSWIPGGRVRESELELMTLGLLDPSETVSLAPILDNVAPQERDWQVLQALCEEHCLLPLSRVLPIWHRRQLSRAFRATSTSAETDQFPPMNRTQLEELSSRGFGFMEIALAWCSVQSRALHLSSYFSSGDICGDDDDLLNLSDGLESSPPKRGTGVFTDSPKSKRQPDSSKFTEIELSDELLDEVEQWILKYYEETCDEYDSPSLLSLPSIASFTREDTSELSFLREQYLSAEEDLARSMRQLAGQGGIAPDVLLIVDEGDVVLSPVKVKLHRLVAMARCPYFSTMCRGGWKDHEYSTEANLIIRCPQELTETGVRAFVDYLYGDTIRDDGDVLIPLLETQNVYGPIPRLRLMIESALISRLQSETVIPVLGVARRLACPVLERGARSFLLDQGGVIDMNEVAEHLGEDEAKRFEMRWIHSLSFAGAAKTLVSTLLEQVANGNGDEQYRPLRRSSFSSSRGKIKIPSSRNSVSQHSPLSERKFGSKPSASRRTRQNSLGASSGALDDSIEFASSSELF